MLLSSALAVCSYGGARSRWCAGLEALSLNLTLAAKESPAGRQAFALHLPTHCMPSQVMEEDGTLPVTTKR